MTQLTAEVKLVKDISASTRAAMYELYSQFYDATNEIAFSKDLNSKTHTVILRDHNRGVQGFTSLAQYQYQQNGKRFQIVYSGDTIIHQSFWGEQTLPEAWIQLMGHFKAEFPERPLYWFLIVKGHRTYRYLSAFSKQYYPCHKEATPNNIQQLLNALAADRFPEHYKPNTGLIQFPQSRGHLNDTLSVIPSNALKREDVQFFLERNPDYALGDELVCLAEISLENLHRRAGNYFRKGLFTEATA